MSLEYTWLPPSDTIPPPLPPDDSTTSDSADQKESDSSYEPGTPHGPRRIGTEEETEASDEGNNR